MDPLTQQSQAPINGVPRNTPAQHKKVGPIIAILIIVLILIVGALYLFASRINKEQAPTDSSVAANASLSTSQQPQTNAAAVENQSVQPVNNKADDVNSLQTDLNASTNGLDNQNF